ncbi:hypothetical protein [Rhodococcus sp. IEGM 1379]|nr:hypothetical protein [Rhodococcus sp. IEGM 1379]MDI9915668.1 hypothetical protein [Rhodococcus sp. IEGM 1379]
MTSVIDNPTATIEIARNFQNFYEWLQSPTLPGGATGTPNRRW